MAFLYPLSIQASADKLEKEVSDARRSDLERPPTQPRCRRRSSVRPGRQWVRSPKVCCPGSRPRAWHSLSNAGLSARTRGGPPPSAATTTLIWRSRASAIHCCEPHVIQSGGWGAWESGGTRGLLRLAGGSPQVTKHNVQTFLVRTISTPTRCPGGRDRRSVDMDALMTSHCVPLGRRRPATTSAKASRSRSHVSVTGRFTRTQHSRSAAT